MGTAISPTSSSRDDLVRAVLPGLLLATLTLLLGFGLGVVFGLDEEAITSRLAASAAGAPAAVYNGDAAAVKVVLAKSLAYMQRSHLHAGAPGTTAVALTMMFVLLGIRPMLPRVLSIGLGAEALATPCSGCGQARAHRDWEALARPRNHCRGWRFRRRAWWSRRRARPWSSKCSACGDGLSDWRQ